MLRAYPRPNLRRLVVVKGPRELKTAYTCIRCLFARPVARSTGERAAARSPILLEMLPCLADPERVHLRIVRPEGDADVW
jgi:hypothetical protein